MSRQHSGTKTIQSSKQFQSHNKIKDENTTPDQRLLMLENNLNRVSLQQDALMPLLQMIEYIPSIQRTDNIVKNLSKKLEETEHRLSQTEKAVEKKHQSKDSLMTSEKKQNKKYQDLQERISELDQSVSKLSRLYETRVNESTFVRSFDSRKSSSDPQNIKGEFLAEFKNIYRVTDKISIKEIGGLRNDIEFLVSEEKKKKLTEKITQFSKGLESQDRVFMINFLEQEQFIEELEKYEKENSFRINYELECCLIDIERAEKQDDLNAAAEKIINLKYQLAAGKKKYLHELKKIDQKFEILEQFESERLSPQSQKFFQKIFVLQGKMSDIVSKIQQNLDGLNSSIGSVETQLQQRRKTN